MIQVQSIRFGYPHLPLLFQDFSWVVERSQTWAILGPSGCGKTTLLYMLAGLQQPLEGEISIMGETLTRPRPSTGLILQDYGLLPWATVRGNANLGINVRTFYGPDGTHAPAIISSLPFVDSWLTRLGLEDVADKYPAQISGGQRQRTAIARTLALQPDLLLMDEPFSSLDAITRFDLQKLTADLCEEQGITMIMVTHSIEEAATMGRHILLLGMPPNQHPPVFDNPSSGSPTLDKSESYQAMCDLLRARMEHP